MYSSLKKIRGDGDTDYKNHLYGHILHSHEFYFTAEVTLVNQQMDLWAVKYLDKE